MAATILSFVDLFYYEDLSIFLAVPTTSAPNIGCKLRRDFWSTYFYNQITYVEKIVKIVLDLSYILIGLFTS